MLYYCITLWYLAVLRTEVFSAFAFPIVTHTAVTPMLILLTMGHHFIVDLTRLLADKVRALQLAIEAFARVTTVRDGLPMFC